MTIQIDTPESSFEIDRVKLRFNGIGPRICESSGKIWPLDAIDSDNELRKILYPQLVGSIDEDKVERVIKPVLATLFKRLKHCKTSEVFDKLCPLDPGYFDKVSFLEIHHALEAYSSHQNVLNFVHGVLRSINRPRVNLLKRIFGNNRNFDIYKEHVHWLVTGNTKMRSIKIQDVVLHGKKAMDIEQVDWLDGLEPLPKWKLWFQVIAALTRYIADLLRRYFYITFGNPFTHQVVYYRYDLWQAIQSKEMKKLVMNNVLHKEKLTDTVRLPLTEVSKIKFHLKKDGLRLICTMQKQNPTPRGWLKTAYQKRALFSYLITKVPNYKSFKKTDLHKTLRHFKRQNTEEGKTIYFARADMKNCYPSIDQNKLYQILMDLLKKCFPSGSIEFLQVKYRASFGRSTSPAGAQRRRKVRANKELYEWIIDLKRFENDTRYENLEITARETISIDEYDEAIIRPQVIMPVLRESRTSKYYYNLLNGIRQGSKFSTILNSLYIQTAFNKYLGDLIEADDCEIIRYVDDILFISTDLEKSKKFMRQMCSGFKEFNLAANPDKLACNFNFCSPNSNGNLVRQLDEYIIFYKRKISVKTFECGYHYDYNGISLTHTFKATPYNPEESMNSAVQSFPIDPINLDIQLSGLHGVVINIFEHATHVAHRIATLILISFKYRSLDCQNPKLLVKFMKLISKVTLKCIESNRNSQQIENNFDFYCVRLIVIAAFKVTWSRNKMRHRTKELEFINKRYKKSMMQFLVTCDKNKRYDGNTTATDPNYSLLYECKEKISKLLIDLVNNFESSNFAEAIILPNKV